MSFQSCWQNTRNERKRFSHAFQSCVHNIARVLSRVSRLAEHTDDRDCGACLHHVRSNTPPPRTASRTARPPSKQPNRAFQRPRHTYQSRHLCRLVSPWRLASTRTSHAKSTSLALCQCVTDTLRSRSNTSRASNFLIPSAFATAFGAFKPGAVQERPRFWRKGCVMAMRSGSSMRRTHSEGLAKRPSVHGMNFSWRRTCARSQLLPRTAAQKLCNITYRRRTLSSVMHASPSNPLISPHTLLHHTP